MTYSAFCPARPFVHGPRSVGWSVVFGICLLIWGSACVPDLHAQSGKESGDAAGVDESSTADPIIVRGTVTDARTGETIPSATLQVDGTYRGTITNRNGRYSIRVDRLPATLLVRFIGYQTQRTEVTSASEPVHISLQPSVLEMGEVVVTGDDFAENVMRKVIERKQMWWDSLRTYQVQAYNRFTVSNDTGIVSIAESQTDAFWDEEKGVREIVRSRRATANLGIVESLPAALLITNLYEDEIDLAGHRLYGVTHPDAVDKYEFTLDSVRVRDNQRVYDIRVEPASRLSSGFRGRVAILDSAYAMIEADLRPGRSFLFPPPLRDLSIQFSQQFSNYGGAFWLPVDQRAQYTVDVRLGALLRLPKIRIDQLSRLAEYRVNVALPDSLFESDQVVVDRANPAPTMDGGATRTDTTTGTTTGTTTVSADSAMFDGVAIPLSDEEETAYASIDSTQTLEKAFEPKGLIGRLVDFTEENDAGGGSVSMSVGEGSVGEGSKADSTSDGGVTLNLGLRPRIWFNRVEGLHVGGRPRFSLGDRVELYGLGGYATSVGQDRDRWTYGGGARVEASTRMDLEARYRYGVDAFGQNSLYAGRIGPSIYALTGEANYLNFVGAEELRGSVTYDLPGRDIDVTAQVRETEYRPVTRSTQYDLFARQDFVRPNPAVSRQLVRSAGLSIRWESDFIPISVLAQRKAEFQIEHSNTGLGSDVTFTRVRGDVYMRIPTFLQRRLLPLALDLRLHGQTHTGTLPVPRFGAVDAALLPYTPFGALRTRDGQPYLGEHAAAVHWEHSFRTVPFELLRLTGIAKRGWNVILHGGHARTWIDDGRLLQLIGNGAFVEGSNGWHHELGVSISGIGGLIRIDGTARLDEPAFSIGIGLPRLF
jgi:hypothetical protein